MANAICMVELLSIARGIAVSDEMVKAARVRLLRSATICPGKYIVLIGGDTGEVRVALEAGKKRGAEAVADTLFIPNLDSQVLDAVAMTNSAEAKGALGVLEFYSVSSAILGADVAAKAAKISLLEVRCGYAIGGKGFVTFTGDVGAVEAAVKAAKEKAELLVEATIIPRPDPSVLQSLM